MNKTRLNTIILITAAISVIFSSKVHAISNEDLERAENIIHENLHQANPTFSFTLPLSHPDHYSQETQEAFQRFETYIKNNSDEFDRMNINDTRFQAQLTRGASEVTFSFDVRYLATQAQEKTVDAKISQVLAEIIKPSYSEHQKVKAIHDWIISHVTYDKTYQKYSDYNAAIEGSSVCQGFALLGYKMFTKAGIPVHIVSGTGNGELHAWNMVQIEEKWYQIDLTWDENYKEGGANPYQFYLKTNQQFEPAHQFDVTKFPVANTDYIRFLQEKAKTDASFKVLLDSIGGNHPGDFNSKLLFPSSLQPIQFSPHTLEDQAKQASQDIIQPIAKIMSSDSSFADKISQVISLIKTFLSSLVTNRS
jgi:hypothetical protein